MDDFERVTIMANYYEQFRYAGSERIRKYLNEIGMNIIDAKSLTEDIKKEINHVQDMQDEELIMKYMDEGKHDEIEDMNKYDQHVEVVIGRDFVERFNYHNEEELLKDLKDTHNSISIATKIAYKYQLKYALVILDIMLDDEAIWDKITVH